MTSRESLLSRPAESPRWLSLGFSLRFLCGNFSLLGLSLLLMLVTALLTWLGYRVTIHFVDGLVGHFFQPAPEVAGFIGWLKFHSLSLLQLLFYLISRVIAFYLAFLVAYSLASPGYSFLSLAAERRYLGRELAADERFSWEIFVHDLIEGCKIGLFGLLVTLAALFLSLVPLVGSGLVVLLYIFYSALMFIDYPTSRLHWSLGRKLGWLRRRWLKALRLGWLPAFVSMVPVINIFFMAFLFPLFTVHATLNFVIAAVGVELSAVGTGSPRARVGG